MSRYYPGRFNPYNRHDTGIYTVYRKGTNQYLGSVMNCRSEREAYRKASYVYGSDIVVSLVEE